MSCVRPLSINRELIIRMLTRAKRFHCSISGTRTFDLSAVEAARRTARAEGRPIRLVTCLVKATAMVIARFPDLNQHLFHGLLRRYRVEFERVRCSLIVMRRTPDGERVLVPLVIDRPQERALDDLQQEIDHARSGPIRDLPLARSVRRLARLPRVALAYVDYKSRSDYRFYERHFGTYTLSAVQARNAPFDGLVVPSCNAATFMFSGQRATPQVRGAEVVATPSLPLTLVLDHFLLDAIDGLRACGYLASVLSHPERLGLPEVSDGRDV